MWSLIEWISLNTFLLRIFRSTNFDHLLFFINFIFDVLLVFNVLLLERSNSSYDNQKKILVWVWSKIYLNFFNEIKELFFENHYPWKERNNYAVHIYHKRYRTKHSMAEILHLNNTVGDLARFTFDRYDSWAARHGYDPSSRQI